MFRYAARRVLLVGLLAFSFLAPQVPVVLAQGQIPERPLRRIETTEKVVALSFDDGPSPAATPRLLEYLKSQGIHASFFVLGQEAEAYPDLVAREALEGHDVANHGMHHKPLRAAMSRKAMEEEVGLAEAAIQKAGAPKPTFYRAPDAVISQAGLRFVQERGYRVIGWSVDPRDAFRKPAESLVATAMSQVKPGAIMLFHDGPGERQATLQAVETVVAQLKSQGYRIVSVSELLKLAPKAS